MIVPYLSSYAVLNLLKIRSKSGEDSVLSMLVVLVNVRIHCIGFKYKRFKVGYGCDDRRSRSQVFYRKTVLKNLAKFKIEQF